MSGAGLSPDDVHDVVREYQHMHDEDHTDVEGRKAVYTRMVNHYYDLVTDFYEYGWGQSFHFAPRQRGESFAKSIARHEHALADALQVGSGTRILDVGCGVGGPLREIARHTGAHVVGLNNNAYQIERGEHHNARAGLTGKASFLRADFMDIPVEDEHFDGAYTIEASCHAPDKAALFREIKRVLKPGAIFAGYEWCLTGRYVADNPAHQRIKKEIELGDGLPDIAYTHEVDEALVEAGFEVVRSIDIAAEPADVAWHVALSGKEWSLRSLPRTPLGRRLTTRATSLMERLRIAPKGTREVSEVLNTAADALVEGGETGVFTPMYLFVARKPASAEDG